MECARNRAPPRRRQAARFRIPATPEDFAWQPFRGRTRAPWANLTQSAWWPAHPALWVTGLTGVGKTYVLCALGHAACRLGFRVQYIRCCVPPGGPPDMRPPRSAPIRRRRRSTGGLPRGGSPHWADFWDGAAMGILESQPSGAGTGGGKASPSWGRFCTPGITADRSGPRPAGTGPPRSRCSMREPRPRLPCEAPSGSRLASRAPSFIATEPVFPLCLSGSSTGFVRL